MQWVGHRIYREMQVSLRDLSLCLTPNFEMVPMFVCSSRLENLETRSKVSCMMCSFPSYNYTCSFKIGTVVVFNLYLYKGRIA